MRYPAPGAPAVAASTATRLGPRPSLIDPSRGLDHGAWTVLARLYPAADVPVFQLSIDIAQSASYHLAVGRALSGLRDEGVLVIGSGNIVHNLTRTERGAGGRARPRRTGPAPSMPAPRVRSTAAITPLWSRTRPWHPAHGRRCRRPTTTFRFSMRSARRVRDEAPRHRFEGFQAGTLSMRCVQWG